jgi:hypothetical protein
VIQQFITAALVAVLYVAVPRSAAFFVHQNSGSGGRSRCVACPVEQQSVGAAAARGAPGSAAVGGPGRAPVRSRPPGRTVGFRHRAPRGAAEPGGGGRPSPPCRRSGAVKLAPACPSTRSSRPCDRCAPPSSPSAASRSPPNRESPPPPSNSWTTSLKVVTKPMQLRPGCEDGPGFLRGGLLGAWAAKSRRDDDPAELDSRYSPDPRLPRTSKSAPTTRDPSLAIRSLGPGQS